MCFCTLLHWIVPKPNAIPFTTLHHTKRLLFLQVVFFLLKQSSVQGQNCLTNNRVANRVKCFVFCSSITLIFLEFSCQEEIRDTITKQNVFGTRSCYKYWSNFMSCIKSIEVSGFQNLCTRNFASYLLSNPYILPLLYKHPASPGPHIRYPVKLFLPGNMLALQFHQ